MNARYTAISQPLKYANSLINETGISGILWHKINMKTRNPVLDLVWDQACVMTMEEVP